MSMQSVGEFVLYASPDASAGTARVSGHVLAPRVAELCGALPLVC
jgi:hypothetical protein